MHTHVPPSLREHGLDAALDSKHVTEPHYPAVDALKQNTYNVGHPRIFIAVLHFKTTPNFPEPSQAYITF